MTITDTKKTFADLVRDDGVAVIEYAFTSVELAALDVAFDALPTLGAGARHGRLGQTFVASLTRHQTLQRIASSVLGQHAQLVRILTFDKTPEMNWFVPWHQDRSIALEQPADVAGFSNWTLKDGCHHAEPPIEILENMVTLRLHLDAADENNGPLEVVRRSHLAGRLDRVGIERAVAHGTSQLCLCARGDVLVMKPLIVHRSQRAKQPRRRRVIHLEYCAMTLPAPLMWAMS